MRSVMYYYSLEGNTQALAERIAGETAMDICRLVTRKKYPKNFFKFLIGGMDAVLKKCPELMPLAIQPEDYGLVVLATPIWGGVFTPAIRSFLKDHTLSGKKVILVATSSGGDAGRCFQELRAVLGGSGILGEFAVKSPIVGNQDNATAVADAIRKLVIECRG